MQISNPLPASQVWTYITRQLSNPSGIWSEAVRSLTQTQFPYWNNNAVISGADGLIATGINDIVIYTNNTGHDVLVLFNGGVVDTTANTTVEFYVDDAVGDKFFSTQPSAPNIHTGLTSNGGSVILQGNQRLRLVINNANAGNISRSYRYLALQLN